MGQKLCRNWRKNTVQTRCANLYQARINASSQRVLSVFAETVGRISQYREELFTRFRTCTSSTTVGSLSVMTWGTTSRASNNLQLGLLCTESILGTQIHRAISATTGVSPILVSPDAACNVDLLIVVEAKLAALYIAVKRVRQQGFVGTLLAAAKECSPEAVDRAAVSGADDFITLSVGMDELPYRVLALERRASGKWAHASNSAPHPHSSLTSEGPSSPDNDISVNPNGRTLAVDGLEVVLTLRELLLLQYLQSKPNVWITAAELLANVCDCPMQKDTTLVRVHMSSLRKKLGPKEKLLESRRTYGYRWVGAGR